MAELDGDYRLYTRKSSWQMLFYASPRLGISIFIGVIDYGLFFLYSEVYELNPLLTGIATMAGKFAIAISQFLFGWLSDHTNTALGRRKPYLLTMTPLLAISYFLLLLPGTILGANPSESTLFWWFFGFNCLAQFLYAVTTVYQSWTAELFQSKQRPTVSAFQNAFNFVGTAIVTLFNMIILTGVKTQLEDDPTTIPPVYLNTIIGFAILLVVLVYSMTFLMPIEKTPKYASKLLDDLKTILKNKNLMLVCVLQGICSFAWAMIGALLLGYASIVLKIKGPIYILVATSMVVGMLFSLVVWAKHMKKHGKELTLQRVFLTGIIITPLSVLGYFSFSTNLVFAVPFIVSISVAMGGWYLFPYIMYADIAEHDLTKTGKLKAGIYTGFPSIILNIFQALSFLLTGAIIKIGYKITNIEGTKAFSLGYLIWGPIASIILIISLLYARKFIKLDFKQLS